MNVNTIHDVKWTTQMDPAADAAAVHIMKRGGLPAVSDALELLSNRPPDKPAPAGLAEFVGNTQVPPGVDQDRINLAQTSFATWGVIGTATLFCASLPETYCLPGIAQLLCITGQLTEHATRRIKMTGQMLFDVMMPGGITAHSPGLRSLQRTRLIHAAVRAMRLDPDLIPRRSDQKPRPDLDALDASEQFGQPINQLELVYTLMTFSHVVLRSAGRLGVMPDRDKSEAFMYAWNVAGQILGIDTDLLPDNRAEAELVFEGIQKAHARPIEGTAHLVAALEASWQSQFAEHHLPLAKPWMRSLFQTLLTPATRAILGITGPSLPEEHVNALLGRAVEGLVRVGGDWFRRLPPTAQLAAAVNIFLQRLETDHIVDGGLHDTADHMRAWADQIGPPTASV